MKHVLLLLLMSLIFPLNCERKDDCVTWFPTQEYIEIINAGNNHCNSRYYPGKSGNIIINGKNSYYGGDIFFSFTISWDIAFGWSLIDKDNNILYYLNQDTPVPPTSNGWQVQTGTPPAPSSIYFPVSFYPLPCEL